MNNIKTAFDIGNSSLKIAAIKQGTLNLYEVPMPEHMMEEDIIAMPNAFSAFLKKIKSQLHLPKGPAALILPPSQVICRLVKMPYMTIDQLMLNLPYEFNDFIHGETNQYFCDYAICEDENHEMEATDAELENKELTMMAAVAEKQKIQEYIKIFASAGFSLKNILPQEMAYIQLTQRNIKNENTQKEYCFIDLGQLSSTVFIVNNDKIHATRQVHTGMRDLDFIIGDLLNIDPFLANSYKRNNYMEVLEHPRCIEVYERIAVEILKLINFYHFTYRQNQLTGIYITGGGGEIPQLIKVMEEVVGLPVLPVSELLPHTDGYQNLYNVCLRAAAITFSK